MPDDQGMHQPLKQVADGGRSLWIQADRRHQAARLPLIEKSRLLASMKSALDESRAEA